LLLIRWWATSLKVRVGANCSLRALDPASAESVRTAPGGALHLHGCLGQEARALGDLDARVLGAPVIGGRARLMAPIAPSAMEDNAPLRAFTGHMARTQGGMVHVAQPLLLDFLGVNWKLVADDTALCRWSFESEIAAVYLYPSFLAEGDAKTRLQRVSRRWPNARIFWCDAKNTATAFAFGML
jgi:hypothetical protein